MTIFILILTMTYGANSVAITSIEMGSESSCVKAGNKWASSVRKEHGRYADALFTCNKTLKMR